MRCTDWDYGRANSSFDRLGFSVLSNWIFSLWFFPSQGLAWKIARNPDGRAAISKTYVEKYGKKVVDEDIALPFCCGSFRSAGLRGR